VDVVRWGQDGLAVLSSGGNIYLVREPAIVPQLLQRNSAASLTGSSSLSIVHGSGNTLLTLTGVNFLPGVAVTWNGSYRTTTVVDSSHVTVAIPASDLANMGTGTVIATNPGATGSNSLTIGVN
jgi:trimeric autotransporter adhesin